MTPSFETETRRMDGLEQAIQAINNPINSVVWGWPTVLLIAITGIALMVGL